MTWDEEDRERSQVTRRTLTRQEIDNADFTAYLAESESESETDALLSAQKLKKTSKKANRKELRALLLSGNDIDLPEGWDGENVDSRDVDMEITFTPGLSEKTGDQDETTLEAYRRKMKEKRKKKKETKDNTVQPKTDLKDDFFDIGSDDESPKDAINHSQSLPSDQGPAGVTSRPEATLDELALLVDPENSHSEPKHFNLKSILKAEKKPHRKRKQKKAVDEDDNETQPDFTIDVKDNRFKALHEDPQFAIDPTNPK